MSVGPEAGKEKKLFFFFFLTPSKTMTVISGREAEASRQGHAEIILTSPVSVVSRDMHHELKT